MTIPRFNQFLLLNWSLNGFFDNLGGKSYDIVVGNHECRETDNVRSVKSSLISLPFWVTLYVKKDIPGTPIR